MKKILGISAFYHDSAAALVVGGKVVAAAQEERFTRKKHTADFPVQAIRYCLSEGKLTLNELDAVVFYEKPLLKFERLLETYYAMAPRGLPSFLKSMPVWLNEKLFFRKIIYNHLHEVGDYDQKKINLLFSEHHLSHAASAFYASPFEKAAILTIDGVGEWCTASLGSGDGKRITLHKELTFPHSVGLLYSAFTYYLGFEVNSGEYKLMGLAPYGNAGSAKATAYLESIRSELVDIKADGSIWLNPAYFSYATGLRMVPDAKWEKLFGMKKRNADEPILQSHCDLAWAAQQVTEEVVLKMAREVKRISPVENLCMAGGVALNCVANGRLQREGIFKNIFIQPSAGDAGGALGAAWAVSHLYFEEARTIVTGKDGMSGTYLGPSYSDADIELLCRKTGAVGKKMETKALSKHVASVLAEGKVAGWFKGRMEFGPRALGNRSILGDARNPGMQRTLNLKIKYREGFRPFAPAVLSEDASSYFDLENDSPYMLLVAPVKENRRIERPAGFANLDVAGKLACSRSDIQAVTHIDYSARVQTVTPESNPGFRDLLQAFKEQTGQGILVNTSFNIRGEPMVCSPYDAYRCFMSTEMDYLVLNDYLFVKTEQPGWPDKESWRKKISITND